MIKIEQRDNGTVHLSGYVCAVGRDSQLLPPSKTTDGTEPFVEMVTPGAFADALCRANAEGRQIQIKSNHDKVLNVDNLQLCEDSIGLHIEVDVHSEDIQPDKLRGWSFGFSRPVDKWEDTADGHKRRVLLSFDLVEISALTITPAYAGTSIEVRSYEDLNEDNNTPKKDRVLGINYYRHLVDYLQVSRH